MSLLLSATILILTFSGHCFFVYTTLGHYSWRKINICPSVWVMEIRAVSVESSLMVTFLNSNAKRSFWNIRKKSSELNLKKCTETHLSLLLDDRRPFGGKIENRTQSHGVGLDFFMTRAKMNTDWIRLEFEIEMCHRIPSSVYLGRDGERKLLAVAAIRDRNANDYYDYGCIRTIHSSRTT